MRFLVLVLASVLFAGAQSAEDFQVYTEHPRITLKAQRLRLLRREKERQSPRWIQFETLIRGRARMPEPAFAQALFFATTGEQDAGKKAVELAALPSTDARQVAIVYDWCQSLLSEAERANLEARLRKAAASPIRDFGSARTVVLAALAIGDQAALRNAVVTWWRGQIVPELISGKRSIAHSDIYPMVEMFHAVRDNLLIDLRDDALPVFKDFALRRLLSYYPAVYPAPENEYRIPYYSGKGEPDLDLSALLRAAELSLVAYDSNAQDMQFLQGWLMHDRFVLRSPLGAPYEFLWANPYQPGLPFEKLPLYLHDPRTGWLLARSSWNEDATWVGVAGGFSQMFQNGRPLPLSLTEPSAVGDVVLIEGSQDVQFRVGKDQPLIWYVTGLKPLTTYDIEIDDEDMTEGTTDRSGTLPIEFTRADNQLVRIREPRSLKTGPPPPSGP